MIDEIVTETIDNGTIENVHIAPIGKFYGSDVDGNPVAEDITEDALKQLADELNSSEAEVLCDVDHSASKTGTDRSTHAAGWFSRFIVDPLKGLFASLKLTRHGKELLENREYRFISPTFTLDDKGQPVELHTASLTNMPAFAGHINPILNQEAKEISKNEGIEDMTKEELVELIKETVKNMEPETDDVKEDVKETVEEVKEELKEELKEEEKEEKETVDNSCSETEEKVENACSEVKNEDSVEAETEKEAEKEDVIKIEALNSKPVAFTEVQDKSWANLHGNDFWKYLREHPEVLKNA